MYKILLFCVCLPALFSAAAQTNHPPCHGYWEGDWGGDYPFNIYLEYGENGKMKGTITWNLVHYRYTANGVEKTETHPKEFIEGAYNEKTGVLYLKTTGEDDPYGQLGPAIYQMQMQESGAEMRGFTISTEFSGTRTNIVMSRMRT